jgi:hypothetical protein
MLEEQFAGPSDEARDAQLEADRAQEAAPLPYSHVTRYESEGQRQVDLAAAERGNIARAAGELGLTTTEWGDLRKKLGRSPSRGDVQR